MYIISIYRYIQKCQQHKDDQTCRNKRTHPQTPCKRAKWAMPLSSVIRTPSWPCWLLGAKVLSPFQHTNLIQWRNFHHVDDHKNESLVMPVRYIDLQRQVLQDWRATSMEPRHKKGLRWGPISSPSRIPGYAVFFFFNGFSFLIQFKPRKTIK